MELITEREAYGRFGDSVFGARWSHGKVYMLPRDSGVKNALSIDLAERARFGASCLRVVETDVWPSSQNRFLFDVLARDRFPSYAMGMDLSTCAIVFDEGEHDWLGAFLSVCLNNIWGFALAPLGGTWRIDVDHDEAITVLCQSVEALAEWDELLGQGRLPEIGLP